MKAVLLKTLVAVVGGVLVVPFVAAAVLVGARAVAGAGATTRQSLAMFALALVWTSLGGMKGFARGGAAAGKGMSLPPRVSGPWPAVRPSSGRAASERPLAQ